MECGTDRIIEFVRLIQLTRKSIDQESVTPLILLHRLAHCILEKLDRDGHGYDLALLDVLLDHISKFGSDPILLASQEISGAEMGKVVIPYERSALRSLSCAYGGRLARLE